MGLPDEDTVEMCWKMVGRHSPILGSASRGWPCVSSIYTLIRSNARTVVRSYRVIDAAGTSLSSVITTSKGPYAYAWSKGGGSRDVDEIYDSPTHMSTRTMTRLSFL